MGVGPQDSNAFRDKRSTWEVGPEHKSSWTDAGEAGGGKSRPALLVKNTTLDETADAKGKGGTEAPAVRLSNGVEPMCT